MARMTDYIRPCPPGWRGTPTHSAERIEQYRNELARRREARVCGVMLLIPLASVIRLGMYFKIYNLNFKFSKFEFLKF